jgi:hypothetical protein
MPEMMEMPTHEVAMGTTEVWAMPSKVRDMTTDVTTEMTAEVTATEMTATEVTAAAVTATEVTAATARKSVGSSGQTAKRENCCQRKS